MISTGNGYGFIELQEWMRINNILGNMPAILVSIGILLKIFCWFLRIRP